MVEHFLHRPNSRSKNLKGHDQESKDLNSQEPRDMNYRVPHVQVCAHVVLFGFCQMAEVPKFNSPW